MISRDDITAMADTAAQQEFWNIESDSDMQLIEMINKNLLEPEDRDTRYDNSPFFHIKGMGAKQKGKYYELITEDVLQKIGFTVEKPTNTDHDRIINGVKSEIKGSTLNKGTEVFSFLQIRPAQDYQQLVFTMCYPDRLVIMRLDKSTVTRYCKEGVFKKQHGGQKAESGTFCYYGNEQTLLELGAEYIK